MIKTRKIRLKPSKYIRLALLNIVRAQWWLSLPTLLLTAGAIYLGYHKTAFIPPTLLLLYTLFWLVQFYGLTKMEENQLLFKPLTYELSKDRILMLLDSKRGMPIDWKLIQAVRAGKDYFILIISKAQLIYLPYSAFQNQQQLQLVRMLLKSKKLLKK